MTKSIKTLILFLLTFTMIFSSVAFADTGVSICKNSDLTIDHIGKIIVTKNTVTLKTETAVYPLIGKASEMKTLRTLKNQIVQVYGIPKGKKFSVTSHTVLTVVMTGVVTLKLDKVSDGFIGFLVSGKKYGLTGNVAGLKAMDGKRVQVTGYIPDLRYIREPDFIIFQLDRWQLVK